MADFPPNLDDGELWIPSDIFLSDAPSKTASPPPPPPPPSFHFRRLTSLPSSQLQRFGPANQYAATASPPPYGPPPAHPTALLALSSGSAFFSPAPVLYYQVHLLQPLHPAHSQGVAAAPHARFLFQDGLPRPEAGGTGVFLPRTTDDAARRKQVSRNRSMAIQNKRNEEARRGEVAKAQEWWFHGHDSAPHAATALPGDWTY